MWANLKTKLPLGWHETQPQTVVLLLRTVSSTYRVPSHTPLKKRQDAFQGKSRPSKKPGRMTGTIYNAINRLFRIYAGESIAVHLSPACGIAHNPAIENAGLTAKDVNYMAHKALLFLLPRSQTLLDGSAGNRPMPINAGIMRP